MTICPNDSPWDRDDIDKNSYHYETDESHRQSLLRVVADTERVSEARELHIAANLQSSKTGNPAFLGTCPTHMRPANGHIDPILQIIRSLCEAFV